MQPTCLTCGRPVEEGRTCCHTCLAEMNWPDSTRRCPDCGDPIPAGRTLCDFCLAKRNQPQSYPPSIVPAAEKAMKAAVIESILLSVDNMTQQLGMMRNLLIGMKEADQ